MNLVLRKWGVIQAQGVIAILAGVLIVINIYNSWSVLVYFSLFIFIDAILTLNSGRRWSLILQGLAGILVSLLLILVLGLAEWNTPLNEIRLGSLSTYIGFWAIASGLFQVITALDLRLPLRKSWLYGAAGLLTLIFGLSKLAVPASNLMFLAVYAYIYGVLLTIFALRLRVWLRSETLGVGVISGEAIATEGSTENQNLPELSETPASNASREFKGWWASLIRGFLALLLAIGSTLILWFQSDVAGIFILFSFFAILGGIFTIIAVPSWSNTLAGIISIIAGTFIFFMTVAILLSLDMYWPEDMTLRILRYIVVWGILTGLFEGITAIWLRRLIHGEWQMAASGGITVGLGLILLAAPAQGLIVLTGYAFIFGGLQIALAFRMLGLLKRTSLPEAAPEK